MGELGVQSGIQSRVTMREMGWHEVARARRLAHMRQAFNDRQQKRSMKVGDDFSDYQDRPTGSNPVKERLLKAFINRLRAYGLKKGGAAAVIATGLTGALYAWGSHWWGWGW